MTLELDGLTHCYGDEVAVEDVSFGIDAGEIVGLLGPSGCGKTTIVQAIAGHVNPTDGGVRLRGRDVTDNPPETRDVGIVFQEPTLFPHMTVEENVAYGLKPQDIDPAERSETVERYLELVSLGDQREAFPSALSGGQKRRVELARALAPEPDLLLLDEPLSALDRALRERLRKEIARIQRETGVATLYVTHDQETAMGLADRLVVVTEGQVAGVGEPRDLYESPSSPFVAAFLGGSNRLPVTVDANGEFTVESHALAVDGGDRPGEGAIT
ncbi:MAG: ABC transporter ATP-binding protein, partial [Halapricum sp.]